MRIITAVVIPALLQCLFVFVVIEMNTGNGSWVGLGALLIGMFAIPATATTNFLYARANKHRGLASVFMRSILIAIIAPVLTLLLLLVG